MSEYFNLHVGDLTSAATSLLLQIMFIVLSRSVSFSIIFLNSWFRFRHTLRLFGSCGSKDRFVRRKNGVNVAQAVDSISSRTVVSDLFFAQTPDFLGRDGVEGHAPIAARIQGAP